MFTEGLDPHALRWVQQETRSNSTAVLPRPDKFRSGHLNRTYVPVSRTIPGTEDSVSSSSDMEVDSDFEDDRFNARYYRQSPPKSNTVQPQRHQQWAQRCSNNAIKNPVKSSQYEYSSDTFSDLGSSRRQQYPQKQKREADSGDETDEEESESAASSEFNSGFQRHNQDRYTPSGKVNSRSASFQGEAVGFSEKIGCSPAKIINDVKVPSAPPLHEPARQINEEVDRETLRPRSAQIFSGGSTRNQQSTEPNARVNASTSNDADVEATTSGSVAVRVPNFHASGQGPWYSVIAYDACVRLCLHSWAIGCMEAPTFLENECALLRSAFGLQQILLQSEEELLAQRSSKLTSEVPVIKPRKTMGRMKVQIRRVRMVVDGPPGCGFSSLQSSLTNLKSLRHQISNLQSTLSSGWGSLRSIRLVPHLPASRSFSRNSLAYMHASTQYIKQVSALLKVGVTTLRSRSSYDAVQAETYSCHLRLKSSSEMDFIKMQPGSSESHVFFPDSLGDDLIIEILDSKGNTCGRVVAQVAAISENGSDKVRWWPIYCEPEHELVGHVQLFVGYSTGFDDNASLKCGSVAETMAYDVVLEVAMKVQQFQQRNLLLHGSWQWLLSEFASYYGVSDAYTKLRYLSYVMDVATPTADCLNLVYDLLSPVILGNKVRCTLSHQENRILGEIEEQVEQILSMVFENYKSLDESSSSGMIDLFKPASGSPAPVLLPAVKLFTLLHDILSPESQLKLCGYFQTAVKKRSRRHLLETDEYIGGNSEGCAVDSVSVSAAYQKMKALCLNIRNEVFTDIEIHNHHVLPSFVDLPNISASIYSVELCNRLRAFLVACPPAGPASPVADLVIATADFQRDLVQWNLSAVKGGVDAKELFHLYIVLWIQDKRLLLLESCKLDKVKWSGVKTQHATTPFVDEMYDRLREMLNEYEVIICRWPEYIFLLENAVADVEKAVIEALEKQYVDVLAPLKDSMTPKKFGLKYVQKLAKRGSPLPYTVPEELGIVLNTMKRLLDVLRPRVEVQLKSWGACIPDGGGAAPGESLSEVTVLLRAKFRNYLQALVDKLANNSRGHSLTKMKKIIQDSREVAMEADIRGRMQPLKEQLASTIDQLHSLMQPHVFIAVCRGLWDRMGQDVLNFLENRKENRAWYKGARVAVAMLDDTFGSQMQQLLGNALLDKDLEPPRCIVEVRSVLCRDAHNHKDSNSFYY
ncbi:pesticidal crystal cry8Ba protein [Wolffia australiana]